MTYAGTRAILDADSHVMELAGFLDEYIDPGLRDQLRRDGVEALRPVLDHAVHQADAATRRPDEDRRGGGASPARQGLERLGPVRRE